MTEPAVNPETETEKKARGAKPFTLTALARELERAERKLNVAKRKSGLDAAEKNLERAQKRYTEAKEAAAVVPELEEAERAARAAFDAELTAKDSEGDDSAE